MSLRFRNDTQAFEYDVYGVNATNVNVSSLTPTYPVYADSNSNLVTFPPTPVTPPIFATSINGLSQDLGNGQQQIHHSFYNTMGVGDITWDGTEFTINTAGYYRMEFNAELHANSGTQIEGALIQITSYGLGSYFGSQLSNPNSAYETTSQGYAMGASGIWYMPAGRKVGLYAIMTVPVNLVNMSNINFTIQLLDSTSAAPVSTDPPIPWD